MTDEVNSLDGQVWLPMIRSNGCQSLGQAILRLASLAEAAHLGRVAGPASDDVVKPISIKHTDVFYADDVDNVWADGPARQGVGAAVTGGRDHTEVNR